MKGPVRQKYDQKNRVKKRRVVGRICGMKYDRKGHRDRNRHKNRIKRSEHAQLVDVQGIKHDLPTR